MPQAVTFRYASRAWIPIQTAYPALLQKRTFLNKDFEGQAFILVKLEVKILSWQVILALMRGNKVTIMTAR